MISITEGLKLNYSLRLLSLQGNLMYNIIKKLENNIRCKGARALANVLKFNNSLRFVDLNCKIFFFIYFKQTLLET